MKKTTIYYMLALLLMPFGAAAQATGAGTFTDSRAEKNGDTVRFSAAYDVNGKLSSQSMILLTPMLRSLDGKESITFDPILIIGKSRNKALRRGIAMGNYQLGRQPSQTVVYRPHSKKYRGLPAVLDLKAPYAAWMRNAELLVEEQVVGCRFLTLADNGYSLLSPAMPPVQTPAFQVAYVQPPVETVKQRSDTYAARLNFHVNRTEILRSYMHNAVVLDEVDKIIEEVKDDKNLTFSDFRVTGYASPEGNAANNVRLSENRAKAFVSYVQNKHGIPASAIKVDWKGEDWDGLRKLMEESNFADKDRVLNILKNTSDPEQRKIQLKALGASTYQALMNNYFPYLRRNEYTISYVARPFSLDEAKELVKTKPQQLSLDEMFQLANSYPKNSAEFKEVFAVASRLYPDNDYANVNSGALAIENGAYDDALARLSKANLPQAWNNIGFIYVQKKDYAKAAEYFKRAADAGLDMAKSNLTALNKWLAEM
jgi:outer membrane protein OmpA-like peptidoglycan-associated protein